MTRTIRFATLFAALLAFAAPAAAQDTPNGTPAGGGTTATKPDPAATDQQEKDKAAQES